MTIGLLMGLIVLTFFYLVAVHTVFLDCPFFWLPLRFSVAFIDNYSNIKLTLENTEGSNKNEHSSETCNIEYTRRRQTKQKHNTICIGYLYAQANTNKVNKTWALLQLEIKMNRTSFVCGNHHGHHKRTQNVNTHNRTTQSTKNLSNTDTIIKPGVNSCAREW